MNTPDVQLVEQATSPETDTRGDHPEEPDAQDVDLAARCAELEKALADDPAAEALVMGIFELADLVPRRRQPEVSDLLLEIHTRIRELLDGRRYPRRVVGSCSGQ